MYRSSFSDHSFVFWMLVYTKLPGTDLNIVLSKLHYQSMYVNLCDLQRFAMESLELMTSVIPHKVAQYIIILDKPVERGRNLRRGYKLTHPFS